MNKAEGKCVFLFICKKTDVNKSRLQHKAIADTGFR